MTGSMYNPDLNLRKESYRCPSIKVINMVVKIQFKIGSIELNIGFEFIIVDYWHILKIVLSGKRRRGSDPEYLR